MGMGGEKNPPPPASPAPASGWKQFEELAVAEFSEHHAGNFLERLKHSLALIGNGFDHRLILAAQLFFQRLDGHGVRQVAFVELQYVRNFLQMAHEWICYCVMNFCRPAR